MAVDLESHELRELARELADPMDDSRTRAVEVLPADGRGHLGALRPTGS